MASGKIAIVGAGLAGATVAHELASHGYSDIHVFDQRDHVAGNVHCERDLETGVMVHKYGPHIFHTDDEKIWNWVRQFAKFEPYIQRTKGRYNGEVFSLPINLHTINQFFGRNLNPREAADLISDLSRPFREEPKELENFEEYALSFLGRGLYTAFIRDYTIKQWGVHPRELPASILKRLPMRYDYNDNAYSHRFQGIPRAGYTDMVAQMLDVDAVSLHLNGKFVPEDALRFDHTFYSGCIDEWFGYRLGRLPYRTLHFNVIRDEGDYQGCAVLNSCDLSTPWTRSTEHKHFTPWETHEKTIVYREYSRECDWGDIPYYPIRFAKDKEQLQLYQDLAAKEKHVTFIGRLGTYQYLDMDKTIALSLRIAGDFIKAGL